MTTTALDAVAERIARANLTRFIAQVRALGERCRAESMRDFESLYEWSIREPRAVLARGLALLRGRRRRRAIRTSPVSACWSGAIAWRRRIRCSDRSGSSARGSTSPRTCCAIATIARRSSFWNERGAQRRLTYAELYDEVARVAAALRAHGRRRRRSRRRLSAEHAGDGHRDARDDEHRRDLVVVLAGLRRERRARSVRPDRAARAVLRRRLPLRGTRDRLPRARARDRRSASRRSSAWSSCRTCDADADIVGDSRARVSWDDFARPSGRADARRSSSCRSTIRSTSCTRRARPDCRSAWCTAPAARCFSISRSSCCTPTSRATTASSTSRPAAG